MFLQQLFIYDAVNYFEILYTYHLKKLENHPLSHNGIGRMCAVLQTFNNFSGIFNLEWQNWARKQYGHLTGSS